jgi:hypothetical protein
VSGLVTISATATDNVAVARVEFYVDAAFQGAVTNEPYSMFWDTTVIVDGAHTITATAFDGAGLTNSASVTITTSNGVQLSGAPTNLTASPISDTAIMLTWLDNSDNEDGFQIERALSADGPWTLVATVGPNVTTFMDSDLQPQVVYFYRVRACVGCAPPIAVASTH